MATDEEWAQEAGGKGKPLWFSQRSDHWIRYAAHNHLRVGRIIRSLALLQGEEAAKQFLARIGARVEAARLD